jgi:hypothetical protein
MRQFFSPGLGNASDLARLLGLYKLQYRLDEGFVFVIVFNGAVNERLAAEGIGDVHFGFWSGVLIRVSVGGYREILRGSVCDARR